MSLQCPQCKSSHTSREGEPASTEKHVCQSGNHEFHVHCNYVIDMPRAIVYDGYYEVSSSISAPKAFILLKQILASCQHFQASRLERQFVNGALAWELGVFNELERTQVLAQANSKGLEIEFVLLPAA